MLISGALASIIASPTKPLDGVWISLGYGNVYQIRGTTLSAFEVTTQTCVPSFTAKRLDSTILGREATFKAAHGDLFFSPPGRTPIARC